MNGEVKIKMPPVLFKETQALLHEIEGIFNAPLITYWNNPRGSVCANDVNALYEHLENLGKQETLYLFVKSTGGNGKASLRMVNLLRRYCEKLVVLVPLECSSAATMIALGADEIQMGPMAYLSAVDTSITHDLSPIDRDNDRVSVSLNELSRVVKLWRQENSEDSNPYQYLFDHVHPLVIGAADRADSLSIMLCKEILMYHMSDIEKATEISELLNSKYPSHGYPILLKEAKSLGLKSTAMDEKVNKLLLDLNNRYSEMGQKATTDLDEVRAHSNEILNIIEARDMQIFYQQDKDWFYRTEERRWITLNDDSSWQHNQMEGKRIVNSVLHL